MNERIVTDPAICSGKPVIRGTRIAVQTVLEFLAAGDSTEDVLAEYPALTRDDVQACIDYSSRHPADAGERFIAKWQGAFKLDPEALKDERVAAIMAKHVR